MNGTMENTLMRLVDEVICLYRAMGFPCAHKDRPGVIKVIETSEYHLEFDFACQNIKGVGNGVGLCLYIPETSKFDYRVYFEKSIRNSELEGLAVIEYGKKESNRTHGVVVKCWLKGVDWRNDDFDVYKDRLCQLFDRFHSAMAWLVTVDDVRERFLYWAMDQRLKDLRHERCAWTVVREDLNRQLEKAIGGQVGALAVVKNLNYLDLERTLDQYGLLDDAVENWLDDEHVVPLRSVDSSNVAEIKKTLIANAQIALFNAFLKDRKGCFAKAPEVQDEISRIDATKRARDNGRLAVDDGLLYQSKTEALAALGIRKWKNGPACSSFLDSLYDREGKRWRVLFLDIDKKNDGKGWQRKPMTDDFIVTKNKNTLQKCFGECLPEDNVIVFVAEPNNCGYSFAGTYNLDEDILRQASSRAPLFWEIFSHD